MSRRICSRSATSSSLTTGRFSRCAAGLREDHDFEIEAMGLKDYLERSGSVA